MLRVAIVGVGWAGKRQVQAIGELGRKVSAECLVDSDEEHLAGAARELGVDKTYTDLRDALSDRDVDAVSICTPHAVHCSMAVASAEAGKHVLCEKPMAMSVVEATTMIEAAERNGVSLFVAENLPYEPESVFLRDIAATGKHIGGITFAVMVKGFRAPDYQYEGRRSWLTDPRRGGTGAWMLQGIHSMAQLRHILGEVTTVYMGEHHLGSFQRDDIEGTMAGLLTMASGVHVAIFQTTETKTHGRAGGWTLYGERGILHVSNGRCEVFDAEHGSDNSRMIEIPAAELSSYAKEVEAFADLVSGTCVGPTTAESERRSLAVVEAGYESASSGKPVSLSERFGSL